MRKIFSFLFAVLIFFLFPTATSAAVRLTPTEIVIGEVTKLTMLSSTDKDSEPVGEVRLTIPANIEIVAMQEKQGWRSRSGETTEVAWSGGTIAPGTFEEFSFLVRASGNVRSIEIPVLQVHKKGSVTKWTGEEENRPPLGIKVIDRSTIDRLQEEVREMTLAQPILNVGMMRTTLNTWISLAGVALGGTALYLFRKGRR
ncbi:MAG: DUF1775 domain-containing protein [bacterium]|nr:DUF1775 domain-containing protein [bacterium]